MAGRNGLRRLYSRYYCPLNPNHRVFPYDTFEQVMGTEAPVAGKRGGQILVATANNERQETKWGYCWAHGQYVEAFRKTQHDILIDYLKRKNVKVRVAGKPESAVKQLEARLKERRETAALRR